MLIPISATLIAVGVFVDGWVLPKIVTELPQCEDWRSLLQVRRYLWGLSLLLALDVLGLLFTWIGEDYPSPSWPLALMGIAAYLAYLVRPPCCLSARIRGLRAREQAVEDRPSWRK
jgi:hypothetical protein